MYAVAHMSFHQLSMMMLLACQAWTVDMEFNEGVVLWPLLELSPYEGSMSLGSTRDIDSSSYWALRCLAFRCFAVFCMGVEVHCRRIAVLDAHGPQSTTSLA